MHRYMYLFLQNIDIEFIDISYCSPPLVYTMYNIISMNKYDLVHLVNIVQEVKFAK